MMNYPASAKMNLCFGFALLLSAAASAIWQRMFLWMLALVPKYVWGITKRPWTLVTYVVVEPNILVCGVAALILWRYGTPVGQMLGVLSYAGLLGFTTLVTGFCVNLMSHNIFGVLAYRSLYATYCGPWPVLQAVIIAYCHLASPCASVFPMGALARVQVRHLPHLMFLSALLLDFFVRGWSGEGPDFMVSKGSTSLLVALGVATSWLYLRLAGKLSPVFTVADLLQMEVPSRDAGCAEGGHHGEVLPATFAMLRAGKEVVLPGSTDADAERRRSIAVAALSARMGRR